MTAREVSDVVAVTIKCDGRGCGAQITVSKLTTDETVVNMHARAEGTAEDARWSGWSNTAAARPYTRDFCPAHTPNKPPANLRRTY